MRFDEALLAATDGIGWLVENLKHVSLGVQGGFRVAKNGTAGALMFCTSIEKKGLAILDYLANKVERKSF